MLLFIVPFHLKQIVDAIQLFTLPACRFQSMVASLQDDQQNLPKLVEYKALIKEKLKNYAANDEPAYMRKSSHGIWKIADKPAAKELGGCSNVDGLEASKKAALSLPPPPGLEDVLELVHENVQEPTQPDQASLAYENELCNQPSFADAGHLQDKSKVQNGLEFPAAMMQWNPEFNMSEQGLMAFSWDHVNPCTWLHCQGHAAPYVFTNPVSPWFKARANATTGRGVNNWKNNKLPMTQQLKDFGQEYPACTHHVRKFSHQGVEAPSDRGAHKRRNCKLLIAQHLKQLDQEDAACILYAKKINRLGFDSARILCKHFEQYGGVAKIYLSNATWQPQKDFSSQVRIRPSGMGFIVMKSAEAAQKILAKGGVQFVNGVEISIRSFERREQGSLDVDEVSAKNSEAESTESTWDDDDSMGQGAVSSGRSIV